MRRAVVNIERLIGIGAVTNGTLQTTGSSSQSYSHTVEAQQNRCLLVIAQINSDSRSIDGITYNGVAMTALASNTITIGGGADITQHIFYLSNPATGSNTVAVSYSSSLGASDSANSSAVCLWNVHPTPAEDNTSNNNSSDVTSTINMTTNFPDDIVFDACTTSNNQSQVVPAGQTLLLTCTTGPGGVNDDPCLVSYARGNRAFSGQPSMSRTWTGSTQFTHTIWALKKMQ